MIAALIGGEPTLTEPAEVAPEAATRSEGEEEAANVAGDDEAHASDPDGDRVDDWLAERCRSGSLACGRGHPFSSNRLSDGGTRHLKIGAIVAGSGTALALAAIPVTATGDLFDGSVFGGVTMAVIGVGGMLVGTGFLISGAVGRAESDSPGRPLAGTGMLVTGGVLAGSYLTALITVCAIQPAPDVRAVTANASEGPRLARPNTGTEDDTGKPLCGFAGEPALAGVVFAGLSPVFITGVGLIAGGLHHRVRRNRWRAHQPWVSISPTRHGWAGGVSFRF
jgi:hypothetical protein